MGYIVQPQVVKSSSNANNGSQAGRFYLNANNDSSNDNVNISGRLTFRLFKTDRVTMYPHPLVEERAMPIGVSRFTLERSGQRLETV